MMKTTPERSALMRRIRQEGTAPELTVRRVLTRIGARYRLNVRGLPGRPDIANRRRRKAVFVHGCFWHGHDSCGRGIIPKSNRAFWAEKLKANAHRDAAKTAALAAMGFDILIVWECETANIAVLEQRLREFWFGSDANARNA